MNTSTPGPHPARGIRMVRVLAFLLAMAVLFGGPRLFAQQGTGSIIGSVIDSTGAALPRVQVQIKNTDTNAVYTTTTNDAGFYASPALALGSYEVSASQSGFQTTVMRGIAVQVDKRTEADLTLAVGEATQSVEVNAETTEVVTTNATLGDVIESKAVQELPLNGRNALALVTLTPGVRNNLGGTQQGFANRGVFLSATSINGSPTGSNGYILDGQNDMQTVTGEVAFSPTVDAVQEFKVQSGPMSAEYGYTAGGVVNLASRGGTNTYHGTAYEFFRNDALNAINAFALPGQKPALRYNQFGASLGGPIIHERAFFFGNWEEYHYIAGTPQTYTVPTLKERNGDFSELSTPIYDPATTMPNPNGSGYVRSAFTGNIINRPLDPVALAIQNTFYPLPTNSQLVNNFTFEPKIRIQMRQALGRVDYKFSEKNSAFVRYAYVDNVTNDGAAGAQAAPLLYPNPIAANRNDDLNAQLLTVSDTHVFSPNLINNVQLSVTRTYFPFTAASFNQGWPQKLGLPESIPPYTLPVVSNGEPGFNGTAGLRAFTNPQLTNYVTKIWGKHAISTGTDLRFNIGSNLQRNAPSGTFNFPAALTGNPQSPSGTGNTYATFLLGAVGTASLTTTGGETDRSFDATFFVQDDWQVNNRLVANLGLRYDFQQAPYEQNNGYSNFNPNATDSVNGLKGAMEYATANGLGRNFVHDNYLDFSPRIGFAYKITGDGKTVVRGGYGIFYPFTFNSLYTGLTNGFSTTTTSYTPAGNNTSYPAFQFSNGVPSPAILPAGAALGPAGFLGQGVAYMPANFPTPRSQQFSLTIERQLPANIIATATYVGNHGTHFPGGSYNMNTLDPQYLSLGTALQNPVPNPYAGLVPGSLGAATITRAQSLLPFPYYSSVTVYNPHTGDFIAHYMELSAQKRSDRGLTVLAGYTVGKLIDNSMNSPLAYLSSTTNITGYQNVYNREAERSLDPTDISQRATFSLLYDLPFGRGQRFSTDSSLLNAVIGGWQFNSVGVFQTGFPLAISGANNNGTATRPNFVPGVSPKLKHPTRQEWFDTVAFTNPPIYTFGNVPRTLPNVRAPGTTNVDLSLFKIIPLYREYALQFRAESFNAFNIVNLGTPNTTFFPNQGFGTITSAADPRSFQLALKLMF